MSSISQFTSFQMHPWQKTRSQGKGIWLYLAKANSLACSPHASSSKTIHDDTHSHYFKHTPCNTMYSVYIHDYIHDMDNPHRSYYTTSMEQVTEVDLFEDTASKSQIIYIWRKQNKHQLIYYNIHIDMHYSIHYTIVIYNTTYSNNSCRSHTCRSHSSCKDGQLIRGLKGSSIFLFMDWCLSSRYTYFNVYTLPV